MKKYLLSISQIFPLLFSFSISLLFTNDYQYPQSWNELQNDDGWEEIDNN